MTLWILLAWWGVAALGGVGHLVVINLFDGDDDLTWWGPLVVQLAICTAWAVVTPLVLRIARDLGRDPRPARIARAVALGVVISAALATARALLHGFEHRAGVVCGPWYGRLADNLTIDLPLCAAVIAAGLAHAQRVRAAAIAAQLAEARLAALQRQLNPHFLFNTLNTISGMIEHDPAATRTVVARLSALLRRTLDAAHQPEVRLGDELDFIRGYLEIMQHRFGDRLTTTLDVAPGLDDARVPAFVLQPLVENAIEHGVGRIRGPGTIALAVARHGDRLELTVRDNGPGLDPAARDGIGLSNTAARLAQLYPGRSALRLGDDGGRGTIAVVELPYQTIDDLDEVSA